MQKCCSAKCGAAFIIFRISPGSVSYTHLDVYKRQDQYTAVRDQSICALFLKVKACPAVCIFYFHCYRRAYTLRAKDVYKRQIPVSTESIILIITKVEDPEELDTRFSKFAPFRGNDKTDTLQLDGADNIIDIFQKLYEAKMKSTQTKDGKSAQNTGAKENDDTQVPDVNLIRLYEFDTLDDVIAAAHGLNGYFTGTNTLYKDPADELYKLVLHQSSLSPEDFNRVCNILTEYGQGKAFSLSGEAYLTEHGELISDSALQQLIQL